MPEPSRTLPAEDAKLLTLARSAAARAGGSGAAVRDDIGRTYLAGAVHVADLHLSALQAAVAQAVGSGVTRLEAVAVVGPDGSDAPDGAAGPGGPDGPEGHAALLRALGDPVVVRP